MNGSVDELAFAYARLGLQSLDPASLRLDAKQGRVRAEVATNEQLAKRAIQEPFKRGANDERPMMLVPIPRGQTKVYAAFFAPWVPAKDGQGCLSFDLVVLRKPERAIAFRFEPGSQEADHRHGYDHVQLNESLGQEEVRLDQILSSLPTVFPAFPLPSEDTVTRFLALIVAMHGYPRGIDGILERAFRGRPERKKYLDLTKAMLRKDE